MDRDDLVSRIDSYMHRHGDIDTEILTFIEDARGVIGQDLRSLANWRTNSVTGASGIYTLPDDFVEMHSLFGADGQMLEYVSPTYAASWREETGIAQYYTINHGRTSNEMRVYPLQTGSLSANYFERPEELSAGSSSNQVLTDLPFLYIAACMVPAMAWAMDGEGLSFWSNLYDEQVARANRAFKRARIGREGVQQSTQAFAAAPVKGA